MKLHSTIMGEGTPFLILHGFLGMGDNWKTLGRKFSEQGFQVHLLDQRNHGRSPHSDEMSYLDMARDLKEYCDDHSLNDVVLMGHSMGGKTAMWAAGLFPNLFQKLIVVDIAPKYYPPHHQQILAGLKALDEAELDSRTEAEELLAKYIEEEGVRLFLLKNLYWKTKERLGLRVNLGVLCAKVDAVGEALPSDKVYPKPALFIKGAKSRYIEEEDRAPIKKHFPSSRIVAIPNAGHWVHAENQKTFYHEVLGFLNA